MDDMLSSIDPRVMVYATQILRLSAWLLLLVVVFIPLERLFAIHPKKIFRKAILTDLGYYFLNSLVPGVLMSIPIAAVAWSVHRFIPTAITSASASWPFAARVAASMVVGEIGFYWGHRWSHEIPLLWRFHAVHHSAEEMDFLVSTRGHPVDIVFSKLCELTPLYVLGLASPISRNGTLIPILVVLIGTIWGFFIHANLRWRFGPLEWLVATPGFHHWHHTNDGPAYINKNYAPMLPWVDKLFGTLYLPKDKHPASYGIDQPISPILFGQLIDPFLPARKTASPTQIEEGGVHAVDQRAADLSLAQIPDSQTFTEIEG